MTDGRRFAPATERNRDPILEVLREELPLSGLVLEVASGTGEHVLHFARALPGLDWQPSDPDAAARDSIAAWLAHEGAENVRPPILLDASSHDWPVDKVDAILCINMIHISPWEATAGLMRGAARVLPSGGLLYLYGPYRRAGHAIEPSNAAFDENLKSRDPRWGLRALEDVEACAAQHALRLSRVVEMPANNLSVIFRKD